MSYILKGFLISTAVALLLITIVVNSPIEIVLLVCGGFVLIGAMALFVSTIETLFK